jgi:hypothetical protein
VCDSVCVCVCVCVCVSLYVRTYIRVHCLITFPVRTLMTASLHSTQLQVFRATMSGRNIGPVAISVAIKTLKATKSDDARASLLREAALMVSAERLHSNTRKILSSYSCQSHLSESDGKWALKSIHSLALKQVQATSIAIAIPQCPQC